MCGVAEHYVLKLWVYEFCGICRNPKKLKFQDVDLLLVGISRYILDGADVNGDGLTARG